MYQNAYITGRAYRWHWVAQGEDGKAEIKSEVLNPYAVYFDPDSRDVISRADAQFVDICHWLLPEDIAEKFPQVAKEISGNIEDRLLFSSFEKYDHSLNRKHEDETDFHGKKLVVERYYRLKNTLMLAVWAPDTSDKLLYNGPYHTQPKDPATGKVMFPVTELVSDSIMGDSDGFVEFLKDPIKMVSALYTQILEAARHTGSGYLVNRDAFATPEEADRAMKYGPHANKRYELNPKANPSTAFVPIPNVSRPTISVDVLERIKLELDEITSATKALRGEREESGTPASLNQQRIEQSNNQLNSFFSFIKRYLQQNLKLRYAYWRESYTDEMTFRIATPQGGQEAVTINTPQTDWWGNPTGVKTNDISSAKFDIVISDSFKSPTAMAKMVAEILEMLKNPAIAQNPAIAPVLVEEYIDASKLSMSAKEKIKQQQAQQQQMQAMQMQQQGVAA